MNLNQRWEQIRQAGKKYYQTARRAWASYVTEPSQRRRNARFRGLSPGERLFVRSNSWLLVFTGVLTAVGVGQCNTMRRQTALMEQEYKAVLSVVSRPPDFTQAVINFDVKNIGKVSAPWFRLYARERRIVRDNGPCMGGSLLTVNSREAVQADPTRWPTPGIKLDWFEQFETPEIMAYRETVQVFGWIEYDNGFGQTDRLPFCRWYDPKGWGFCELKPGDLPEIE